MGNKKVLGAIAALGLMVTSTGASAGLMSYTDNFDNDPTGGTPVSSFTSSMDGTAATSFTYTFEAAGDAGDMTHVGAYGEGNGTSIDLLSTLYDFVTEETVSIRRTNGENFYFSSIFVRNDGGETGVSIGGFLGGQLVGAAQSVALLEAGIYSFGDILVDEVRLISNDFFQVNIDSLSVKVVVVDDPNPNPIPAPASLLLMGLGLAAMRRTFQK